MVMVNTPIYGGSGGSVATFSLAPSAVEIAIHEMGHTAFHFADEYEYYAGCNSGETGHDNYVGGEPAEPNVTIDTNRATNKWRALIQASTALATTQNSNCSRCDPQASPVPAGAVGAFEGARYFHCGCYRPEFNCRMRALGQPFCAVCQQVIRQTFAPYLQPTAVTLVTPSIAFTDIPEGSGGTGVTTYRAIVFDVISCAPITLRVSSGPTGGFVMPLGMVISVPPGEYTSDATGRLWLSYTSTTAGASAAGQVTVHCDETGQDWTITIVANTVARPKAAVAFIFDHSGSMIEDAGDGTTKVQKLREAAGVFLSTMLDGDGIGVVRFDDTAQILMPITNVGPTSGGVGRATAQGIISGPQLDPAGSTSIGDGVVKGKQPLAAAQALGTPHYDVTAMVVLTDGQENTPPYLSAVGSSITANTFAVGLGLPSNISTTALATLTQGHNGYLLITGTLTTDQTLRLSKYFLQILAGISNAGVVLDPLGHLVYGAEQRIPFLVSEADMGMDVILLSPAPYLVDFQLETPDGQRIDPTLASSEPAMQFASSNQVSYYRFSLPALRGDPGGSYAGTWHAVLQLGARARQFNMRSMIPSQAFASRALPYNLVVHSYSNLRFKAFVEQSGFAPGAVLLVGASLLQYDYPLEGQATVFAEITLPDGGTTRIQLDEHGGGQFAANFTATRSGLYTMRIRAAGSTLEGTPFTREQTLSAAILANADLPSGHQGRTGSAQGIDTFLCDLLQCLVSDKVIGGELRRELGAKGLDLAALQDCLAAFCRNTQAELEASATRGRPGGAGDADLLAQLLRRPELQDLVRETVRRMITPPINPDFADFSVAPRHSPAEQNEPAAQQLAEPPAAGQRQTRRRAPTRKRAVERNEAEGHAE
jgi:hypothetical protein